ncbi:MAG: YbaY family lipoprotein [Opitutales bacterium]|nr:YbaY family lipoprotein [Opitutales bacterium]
MRILKILSLVALMLGLFTACQTTQRAGGDTAAPRAAGGSTVSGTVVLPSGAVLSGDVALEIRLIDASRGVAQGTIISQERFANPGASPMSFRLRYDRNRISPDAVYLVEAFVFENGLLRYTNTRPFQVLTQGFGDSVDMTVVRVAPN